MAMPPAGAMTNASEKTKLFIPIYLPRFVSSARRAMRAVTRGMLSISPNVQTATVSAPNANPRPSGINPNPTPSRTNEILIIRVSGYFRIFSMRIISMKTIRMVLTA
jgi:hypothetical protein